MLDIDFAKALEQILGLAASAGTPVVCAVVAALIFAAKGKPWTGGAALGFFLGPLGVIIALVTGGKKRSYSPQPVTVPQMTTYAPLSGVPPTPKTHYRLPGRCPHCNGPLHRQKLESISATCFYCGAQVEGVPVQG